MLSKSFALAALGALALATGSASAAPAALGIGAPATADSHATEARWVCNVHTGCREVPNFKHSCRIVYVTELRYNAARGIWQYVNVPVTRCS